MAMPRRTDVDDYYAEIEATGYDAGSGMIKLPNDKARLDEYNATGAKW
jgi:uncharacterized protein YdhG (YjbR/CyaY superfamily)